MKIFLMLSAAFLICLPACDRGRQVSRATNPETAHPGERMPLPGDATKDHWAPPSSGKAEGLLPDPLTGTPNQNPNP